MRKFHFIAFNRAGQVIYKEAGFRTMMEAQYAACIYLQKNFEVKEVSARKGE